MQQRSTRKNSVPLPLLSLLSLPKFVLPPDGVSPENGLRCEAVLVCWATAVSWKEAWTACPGFATVTVLRPAATELRVYIECRSGPAWASQRRLWLSQTSDAVVVEVAIVCQKFDAHQQVRASSRFLENRNKYDRTLVESWAECGVGI